MIRCTKTSYANLPIANREATKLSRKNKRLKAYKCEHCEHWHLATKKKKAEQRQKTKEKKLNGLFYRTP